MAVFRNGGGATVNRQFIMDKAMAVGNIKYQDSGVTPKPPKAKKTMHAKVKPVAAVKGMDMKARKRAGAAGMIKTSS